MKCNCCQKPLNKQDELFGICEECSGKMDKHIESIEDEEETE